MRRLAVLVTPVMPRAAARIFRMLGVERDPGPADLAWGVLEPGTPLGTIEPLFPRVEKAEPAPAKDNQKEKPRVSEDQPTPPPAEADAGRGAAAAGEDRHRRLREGRAARRVS